VDLLLRDNKALPTEARDAKALAVLTDKTRWRIACLLAEHPDYPTSIAKKLKMNDQLVHYHIRRMQKAGLVKIEKVMKIKGATARYFTLTAPAFTVVAKQDWKKHRTHKQPPDLLADFIEHGKLNCKIVVGSPDSHGPQKQRARDLYHGIDLALLLGSYCTEISASTFLDTELHEHDLHDNIICIGGPISNLITARFTENTPIKFKGREIVSSRSKKAYTEASNGIIIKAKNPLNPKKTVLVLAGKSSPGTRAAILTLIKHPEIDYSNKYNKKHIAKVVEGLDLDGDGIIDEIEIKE